MPFLHKSVQDTPVFDTFCLKQLQSWSSVACRGCPNATCFDGHLCAQTCCLSWTNFNEHISNIKTLLRSGRSFLPIMPLQMSLPVLVWKSPRRTMESTVRGDASIPLRDSKKARYSKLLFRPKSVSDLSPTQRWRDTTRRWRELQHLMAELGSHN